MKTSYTCSDARCPKCKAKLTGATDPSSHADPAPDDLSVSAYCGALLIFNNDLTMREATREDLAGLRLELAWKIGLIVGAVHLRLKEERDGKH